MSYMPMCYPFFRVQYGGTVTEHSMWLCSSAAVPVEALARRSNKLIFNIIRLVVLAGRANSQASSWSSTLREGHSEIPIT